MWGGRKKSSASQCKSLPDAFHSVLMSHSWGKMRYELISQWNSAHNFTSSFSEKTEAIEGGLSYPPTTRLTAHPRLLLLCLLPGSARAGAEVHLGSGGFGSSSALLSPHVSILLWHSHLLAVILLSSPKKFLPLTPQLPLQWERLTFLCSPSEHP